MQPALKKGIIWGIWLLALAGGATPGLPAQAGQRWALHLQGGPTWYAGDLSVDHLPTFAGHQATLGVGLSQQYTPHWQWIFTARRGALSAADDLPRASDWQRARRFSFHTTYTELALVNRYHWRMGKALQPYLGAGLGLLYYRPGANFSRTTLDDIKDLIELDVNARPDPWQVVAPLQAGATYHLGAHLSLELGLQGVFTFSDYLDGVSLAGNPTNRDWYGHLQLGLAYRLGRQPDTDGDGIADHLDECPTTPGNRAGYGCPDADGDGVVDPRDACPDLPGDPAQQGCPTRDADADGIPDYLDTCPNLPGDPTQQGCPTTDLDADGIPDYLDDCPQQPGPEERRGCPPSDRDQDGILDEDDHCPDLFGEPIFGGCPDTDGDGIADTDDACPSWFGHFEDGGCPSAATPAEEARVLNRQFVLYPPNSARTHMAPYLERVAQFLLANPTYRLMLYGHDDGGATDDAGRDWALLRARAVYDDLLSRGLPPHTVSYQSQGNRYPLADGTGQAVRENNRRVELRLFVP